ncbi:DUF5694 domain-containing protein [Tenacibaculum xiamenense]|uniref:DUF5694 domain-containing protein n=1 Tax=Tenacibaculum xiamenense TaxID=1261553 RepID=UPI0038B4A61D
MKSILTNLLIVAGLFTLVTQAQMKKTEVLILGTQHLHHIKGFEKPMLKNVISKLESYNFDVVCIEKMSGELLNDIVFREDRSFDGITKGSFGHKYLAVADTVQKVKKVTFLEAKRNIEVLKSGKKLSPQERKKLLFNYLAVTDVPSAALQYEYINSDKIFKTNFEKYIAGLIKEEIASNNEYYSLAGSLAKINNINKLEPIDNFQDEALLLKYYPEFMNDFKNYGGKFKNINMLPVYQKTNELTQEGIKSNDLSNLYEFLNSDEYVKQDYDAQWDVWHKTNFPSGSDRARHSLWEMRNLQITGNIMKVAARNSGKKILVIIGASHKGFLEKYLNQINDVKVLKYE